MTKIKGKKIILLVTAVVLIAAMGCGVYAGDYYRADETAAAAMQGSETVTVIREGKLTVFTPAQPEAGLIFYPGGKVEAQAYAPLLLELAEENILCVLTEMPLNLAVLDMNAAEGIQDRYPEVEDWFLGGHSLGGSMAAAYLEESSENYEGLVLLASYSTADLSDRNLRAISIYGSEDGVLNLEKYDQSYKNLPENTEQFVMDGGNHAGFGSYGPQEGDGMALISGAEQRKETVRLLTEFVFSVFF